MGVIAVVACCDTKYHEINFVKERITKAGHTPLVVDMSIGPNLPMQGDVTREEILKEGGYSCKQVICDFSKSEAVDAMANSIRLTVPRLYNEKKIDGVLGMGGLQNTMMCSAAFRQLPLGFPKLIVSTVACGYRYFDFVVGDKDITVMPSIVDFCGMNVISDAILANATAAITGMVELVPERSTQRDVLSLVRLLWVSPTTR